MVVPIPQILVVGLGNLPYPMTRHRYECDQLNFGYPFDTTFRVAQHWSTHR